MPYIATEQRERLEQAIEELSEAIRVERANDNDSWEGVLNYTLTSLVLRTLPGRRYYAIARATGVLENVKQEFYRRYAAPYEDEKVASEGDVYPKS